MSDYEDVDPEDLRDIPIEGLDSGLTYQVPRELAELIAGHLNELGYRRAENPTRYWEPPKQGPIHTMNPGRWRDMGEPTDHLWPDSEVSDDLT